jgi:putative FmdB family regulatory protein
MPIYEYYCHHCQHKFDELQKVSDPVLTHCPKCQQPALEKLVSNTSFQLKGGGWYVTDFKGKKNDAEASKTAATANKEDKKEAKKDTQDKKD